jgi:hypothetical protein
VFGMQDPSRTAFDVTLQGFVNTRALRSGGNETSTWRKSLVSSSCVGSRMIP